MLGLWATAAVGGCDQSGGVVPPAASVANRATTPAAKESAAAAPPATGSAPGLSPSQRIGLVRELMAMHPDAERGDAAVRIGRQVQQAESLWRGPNKDKGEAGDGDLAVLAKTHYAATARARMDLLVRMEGAFEQLDGHMNEISREWRRPLDTDVGPLLPIDELLSGFDPAAHTSEDLFASGIGVAVLINFPLTTLNERLREGQNWTRTEWAERRLAGRFARRIPGDIQRDIVVEQSAGERYINGYNLWMHHVLDEDGQRLFPKGMRLISHWNLRDQIRADYAEPTMGLRRQRILIHLMQHIVAQTIPQAVIDNPRVDWNPFSGTVVAAPPAEIEPTERAAPTATGALTTRENDTRYARLLANFLAQKRADAYSPTAPTAIARSFELGREIPEARTVELLTAVCASPLAGRVASLMRKRLGRNLLPQDLWYAGFKPSARHAEADLDRIVAAKYPTAARFESDMPRILGKLGFETATAQFLADHIRVDASRGAGHALQAMRRGDFARLRTRVEPTGMNYKGYNIAIHELGHNVEQVFSLYRVDHTLLAGVPNSAFTEALAFVFQQRDLALLGLAPAGGDADAAWAERVLGDFLATWEIAGVALTELRVWHYLYDHPATTPAELREATVRIAKELWNQYYAPLLGSQDLSLLGVYSHMIQNTLYLADYPLGHLIAFQIEEFLRKKPQLGKEFERMASFGQVTPDAWMQHATGAPLSAEPLLHATEEALAKLGAERGK